MCAVHDLLPTEVPNVRLHFIAVDLHRPLRNVDAGGAFEFFVLAGCEAVDQCCLSHTAPAYQYEFEFIEWLGLNFNSKVIIKDSLCIRLLDKFFRQTETVIYVKGSQVWKSEQ